MRDLELRNLCKKLRPLIGANAELLWSAYATAETPQSKQEAEALIQMLALRHLGNAFGHEPVLLPPPSPESASGEFLLGNLVYGKDVLYPLYLRRENFVKHVSIQSISGGGKTNVAQLLLLGLLRKNVPFLVVDWKRAYRRLRKLPFAQADGIRVYSVGRKSDSVFHWNPLRGPPNVHPKTWLSVLVEALEKSHISGQGVADVLIEVLDKKFEQFGVYQGTHDKFPNFFDAAEELDRVQFRGRRMLWQDSCTRILRTFTFGPAAGAFNARNPLKLEELLDQSAIIELDQELPKPLRVFLTDVLLRWIHLYRLGQGETTRLRHVTFLEEVHNLFPKSLIERQASNSLENVFREIRGFGEGLVTITQHPSLMPIYVSGNSSTQIFMSLQNEDDIAAARRALFLDHDDEVFLDRLRVGEGIVKIKGRTNPCLVRFPKIPLEDDGDGDSTAGGGLGGEAGVD